jgi:hypothetical protein
MSGFYIHKSKGGNMKFFVLAVLLCFSGQAIAQSDIDVVYLKSGQRIECVIQCVSCDSLFISRFSGKNKVCEAFPIEAVSVYLVNNFYTTPAEDMLKATGHFYTGTTIMVAGGIVTALAVSGENNEIAMVGAGVTLLGTIFLYSGLANTRNAARKMNKLQLQNDRLIYKL